MSRSEAALLQKIIRANKNASTLIPNGDDAAVIEVSNQFLALSVDSVVEGIHFSRKYFSPEQIGAKAIEVAASDIVAMGGVPEHFLISLHLSKELANDGSYLEKLYKGVYAGCHRLESDLLGGDIVVANDFALAVTALGRIASKENICTRKGAKLGDRLFISGPVGLSAAGLQGLQGKATADDRLIKAHLEPKARIDLVSKLAPIATSMIDISDGLSSELWHLSSESECGIVVAFEKIPRSPQLIRFANQMGTAIDDYIFHGGEDYELLYSLKPSVTGIGIEIGYIISEQGVWLENQGKRTALQNRGFDHLKIEKSIS